MNPEVVLKMIHNVTSLQCRRGETSIIMVGLDTLFRTVFQLKLFLVRNLDETSMSPLSIMLHLVYRVSSTVLEQSTMLLKHKEPNIFIHAVNKIITQILTYILRESLP